MPEDSEFHWPYTPTPGGGTPPTGQGPKEGRHEIRTFFWLAILNTVIIAAVGIIVWFVIH